ncbi:MAG: rRNA maturation RNase YbeY [Candidatus Omnitrophica bacterium]|nr:rRNA maturation RNase YbeY [Candidatus Omnitrophota bacterium]
MKITVRNLQKKIPVNPKRIKESIRKVFAKEGVSPQEVTVCFINDKTIKRLNRRFTGEGRATDVLAFGYPGKGRPAADIAISADRAKANARLYKTSVAFELDLYAVHAALHLCGYDDRTKAQVRLMRRKESEYAHPKD